MILFIMISPILICLYYDCIYKKRKDGYEQHFKYMSIKQKAAFFVNIIIFIIGFSLMLFGLYKNFSKKNYFIKNGVYAEGEIIDYRIDGLDLWHSTYTYKIQIENNGEKQHYYAWSNRATSYNNSEKVKFYYLEDKYTETYVHVINAMIEDDYYCEAGEISIHASLFFLLLAPFIWRVRHGIDIDEKF